MVRRLLTVYNMVGFICVWSLYVVWIEVLGIL